jgi:hypothetical protein
MKMGSNAVDGKTLIYDSPESVRALMAAYPASTNFLRKYGGTQELLSGNHRWCIWISAENLEDACRVPELKQAIENCRTYRNGAGRDARKAASRPYEFCYSTFENEKFIQVGNTIGSSYLFVPADIKEKGFVSNHNAFVIYGAPLVEFAIIISSLHRVWAETISGKLGNGIRYGNTVVYNTFAVPTLTEKNKADLTRCAEDILLAREAHFPATIADLYDPVTMPANLREAHDRNDEVLERIYIGRRFKNDTERLEKLFDLYTKMTATSSKSAKAKAAAKPRGKKA